MLMRTIKCTNTGKNPFTCLGTINAYNFIHFFCEQMSGDSRITDHSNHSNYSIQFSSSESDEVELMSSESDKVETSSEPTVRLSEGNHEVKSRAPETGMTFPCEEEAYVFYRKYADQIGFKVRKGKVQRSADGSLRKR